MGKYTQTKEEILKHLLEEIRFIKASAKEYDEGHLEEAKRLAMSIRKLVYDTDNQTSILSQLNKKGILFYDSAADYEPSNLLTQSSILIMKTGPEGSEFIAPLDNFQHRRYKKREFNNWWNRAYIFKDKDGNLFSRRDIILEVADTDGGVHVDPNLNQAYANISRFNSLAWRYVNEKGEDMPLPSPVPPAIRQISHEVLKTLQDEFPDLFES
jgi:hypothetical protein